MKEKSLFYAVIALGFITGFWVFFGTLFLKRDWRHAYFIYMWMGLWIRCM